MRRLSVLIAIAALFVVAFPIASASAAPPEHVTFAGEAWFDGLSAGTGVFTAGGSAVGSGAVCPSGTTADVPGSVVTSGGQSPNVTKIRVVKEFTCNDGPFGSFFVKLRVRLYNSGFTTFKWVIKGGTGAYANLKGNGFGFGSPLTGDPDSIYDMYAGRVR